MNVLLVSNMYPSKNYPSYGIFVKKFADELEALGIDYTKVVMKKSNNSLMKVLRYCIFYFQTFFKIIISSPDIVYIHYASHSSAPVMMAKKFKSFKIYTNVHGSDVVPENKNQMKMQKYTSRVLAISDKIICPSEYFSEYVKSKYSINKKKLFVYPSGGIDLLTFHPLERIKAKKQFGCDNVYLTFGYAGRISPCKGWDTFVEAISICLSEGVEANFIIAGDGNENCELETLMEKLAVSNNIKRFKLMPQNLLAEYYNALDFLVFPTRRVGESLGLVAIEAMACGTPVIASDFAAPKHYIQDGVNGYLFDVNNPNSLANRIKYCTQNTEIISMLKEGALNTASQYANNYVRSDLKNIFDTEGN